MHSYQVAQKCSVLNCFSREIELDYLPLKFHSLLYQRLPSSLFFFGSGDERTFSDDAIFVRKRFLRRYAVVGKTLIGNPDLFFTKIVAQSLDASKVVMLPVQLKVNDCSLLFIHFYMIFLSKLEKSGK